MKLNNKGFAISTFMYVILVLAIVLILATLAILSSRKMILDKQKNTALDNVYEKRASTICKAYGNAYSLERGTKYKCEVKNGTKYYFYVLSQNGDDTVNLIMDSNICEDGTKNYTAANNYCTYCWDCVNNSNNYGPVTAMQKVYNATKDWTNILNININYEDEIDDFFTYISENDNAYYSQEDFSYDEDTMGYNGIQIVNGVGKIIAHNGEETPITLIDNKPIKARLATLSEINIENALSNNPTENWLFECKDCNNSFENRFSFSYWLLSSSPAVYEESDFIENIALDIYDIGLEFNYINTNTNDVGIRPVITVNISDLS